jgi:hypothetical protein
VYTIHSTSDGKDALGEVIVKLRAGERLLTGRGLSTDIIESSILAYLNAINKLIAFSPEAPGASGTLEKADTSGALEKADTSGASGASSKTDALREADR